MTDGEIEKKLKAIANKRRFAILKILKNGKSLSVGNLASQLKLSFRSTSKHLNSMYNSGLLEGNNKELKFPINLIPLVKR